MLDEITFDINPVWLEIAEPKENWGPLSLMSHQVACRDVPCPNFTLINAPPSGGKTLASLARVMHRFEVDKNTKSAIFVYPTNALLEDQAKSIKDLLSKKDYKVAIMDGEQPLPESVPDSYLKLLIVNGSTLAAYLDEKVRRKGEAFIKLLAGYRNTIMLTNPDTLTLIFKGAYYRPSSLMRQFLQAFDGCTLVLDEFHLYHGAALAWILYLAWLIRRRIDDIIVSSATLSYQLDDFKNLFEDRSRIQIKAKSGERGHPARKKVNLTLAAGNPPSDIEDSGFFIKKTQELYEESASGRGIRLLVLVDSVAFCDYLAKRLKILYDQEKVGVIHGFVPPEARKDALQKEIVVGTKAVELGIDFDVPTLLFEASDAASFIQRLGRAGRHQDAKAVGIVDRITLDKLKDLNGATIEHSKLEEEISRYMVTPRSYLSFIKSKEATRLYLSVHYSYFERMPGADGLLQIRDFVTRKKESGQLHEIVPFPEQEIYIHDVATSTSIPLFEALRRCFLRGYNSGTAAYYSDYNSFSQISLLDVPRFEVEHFESLDKLEQHLHRTLNPPPWLERNEGVVLLKDFRAQRAYISGNWQYTKGLMVLGKEENFHLHLPIAFDDNLRRALENSLDQTVGYTTSRHPDWRFQFLRGNYISRTFMKPGYLVIGLDALVQKEIDKRNSYN